MLILWDDPDLVIRAEHITQPLPSLTFPLLASLT